MAKRPIVKRTEAEMIRLLRARHSEAAGNGRAHAFVDHVRDAAGFDAVRTIDAMSMGLWPSRGLIIDAFEIKCSRSDWLKELRDPSKAEAFCKRADRFWLVVGDAQIVKDGELPDGWGLLAAQGTGDTARLVQKVAPTMLRPFQTPEQSRTPGGAPLPPGLTRSFLASLMRAATAQAAATPEEIEDARTHARASADAMYKAQLESARADVDSLGGIIRDFEQASGVSIRTWRLEKGEAGRIGEAVAAVLRQDAQADMARQRLERQAEALRTAAEATERALAQLREQDGGG
jgi:hypothetical protein